MPEPASTAARATTEAATTQSTGTGTTASAAATVSAPAVAELPDGRHFGYIKSISIRRAPRIAVFDLAYFLTGEAANQAAADHGDEVPVANDVYIVNDNPKLRTLAVSRTVTIRLLDWNRCCETFFDADPKRFERSFRVKGLPKGNYHGRFSPYWITVDRGEIVRIENLYLP